MGFTQAIVSGFKNYVKFSGRAAPSEFWFWQLFILLAAIAVGLLEAVIGNDNDLIASLWSLATLLPSIAVAVRRLHDTDMSGWWLLLFFVPLIGIGMLIIWWIGEGTRGYNRFGPNPLPRDVSLHAQGRSLHRARTDTAD
jgi:uncharacterized membrane protein YhaH (DUF805 family)